MSAFVCNLLYLDENDWVRKSYESDNFDEKLWLFAISKVEADSEAMFV